MREVEVKAKLKDADAVTAKLRALGCEFGEPVTQEDIIHVTTPGPVEVYLANSLFVRIRTVNDADVIFTVKYNPDRVKDSRSMPIEHEVRVDSKEELSAMLAVLGFKEAVRVHKTRRTGKYENWEICIDEVRDLGSFIEVEQLISHESEHHSVQAAMAAFLETLGVAKEDCFATRYDVAMIEAGKGAV